jgi:hypothetical protein
VQGTSKYSVNLILIIIFIITGGTLTFGFAWYNFSISSPLFRITESFIIIIYLLFVSFFVSSNKIIYRKSPIKYYYYFILLLFFIAMKNIMFMEIGFVDVIKKLREIYILFFIFPIIKLIRTREQLNIFIKALFIISFISSLVYIYQFSTGIDLPASRGTFYEGLYRINHPGIFITTIVFFMVLSHLMVYGFSPKYFLYYIVGFFAIIVVILTISRTYVLAVLVASMIMFFRFFFLKLSSMVVLKSLTMFIVLTLFIIFINFQFESFTTLFSNRMQEGINDIEIGTGSYDARYEMIILKMKYIADNDPLLGVGFQYHSAENEEEGQTKEYYENPIALNADSTYQNILIISGFLGLFLWIFNHFYMSRKSYILFKYSNDDFIKFISLVCFTLPLFVLLHGFSCNYYSNSGCLLLSITIGLIFLADKFEKESFYKKN